MNRLGGFIHARPNFPIPRLFQQKKKSWVISKGSGTGGKKNNNDVEMSQWCPRRIAFV
jgi:hypothetical protein